jgi:hypothetical protein
MGTMANVNTHQSDKFPVPSRSAKKYVITHLKLNQT